MKRFPVFLRATLAVFATFAAAQELPISLVPYHSNGIYKVGEKAGWTVRFTGLAGAPLKFTYSLKENGLDPIVSGPLDLSTGEATIEITMNEPAMIYGEIATERSTPIHFGAAVAPEKLEPVVPRPADFDAFWDAKLKALSEIPINPVLKKLDTTVAGVELYQVTLESLGSHVQGYLAKPAREGKFPALVIYQWAGVYALQTSTVTSRAAEGWLAFDVDSHDMPPDQATGAPANYQAVGNTDRETSYFLNMYLRDVRALDYITRHGTWDRQTLVLTGTSMGGQQSLVTAALHPQSVTAVLVNEPAGADSNAVPHGRSTSYPNWNMSDSRVRETALYFDTVNFAPRIAAPVLAAIGFIDTTCAPAGLFTAMNQVHAPVEVIPMIESDHNNRTPDKQMAWQSRSKEALQLLLTGGTFQPNHR